MKREKKIILLLSLLVMIFSQTLMIQAAGISKKKMTLKVGESASLSVKGTSDTVKWSSKKKSVASVSSDGLVSAKKAGKTVIYAKVGKKTYSCKVTVKKATSKGTITKGDFSAYAGSYKPSSWSSLAYGGGKSLNSLTLNKDGSLSKGGPTFYPNMFPKKKPASVKKQKDGTYYCKINKNFYYWISPVGTIEDTPYIKNNHPELKSKLYLHVVKCDGGVADIVYIG